MNRSTESTKREMKTGQEKVTADVAEIKEKVTVDVAEMKTG